MLSDCYMFFKNAYNNFRISQTEEYPSLVEGTGLENREVG